MAWIGKSIFVGKTKEMGTLTNDWIQLSKNIDQDDIERLLDYIEEAEQKSAEERISLATKLGKSG